MPTVTIQRSLALRDVEEALRERLGSSYEVTVHGQGNEEAIKVKRSPASLATVHLELTGNATSVHVHGGGLVISRMVNEFGIAKNVSHAIEEAFSVQ
jgi:hypothetical protein